MKTKLQLTLISILFINVSIAQKAKDVLEDAINMKNSQTILFTKADAKNDTNQVIEYHILETSKIGILKDSLLFTVKGELAKAYMYPLNPLTYSFESKNELKPDQIDADAANALGEIVTYLKKIEEEDTKLKGFFSQYLIDKDKGCSPTFDDLNKLLVETKKILEADTKKEITLTFTNLKNLDFNSKENTKTGIETAKKEYEKYITHFKDIDESITKLKDSVLKYDCGESSHTFLIQGVFNQTIKDLISVKKEQFKRVENLKLALNAIEKTFNDATSNKLCEWCIEIKPNVTLEKSKIASYTLTLKKSGYRLTTSADKETAVDEIISEDSKEITQKIVFFRKFRRFVPEVSSGIAYTNLEFPKYGAVTDNITGELKVAKIGEDNIKRINITAMINYNYFVDNSDIHPFIQLGAGINTDFPTLFLGTGLRFNAFNGGRFAISAGFAGSWIKSLDTLKIGDVVQDDSDVEKDITYEFAKPKLYYGIQFNF